MLVDQSLRDFSLFSTISLVQDVLVLGTSALQPGAIVDIRPLGYMVMGKIRRLCLPLVSVGGCPRTLERPGDGQNPTNDGGACF